MHTYLNPNYVILSWDTGQPELRAAAENLSVAVAAWHAECRIHPHNELTLQHGSRVIERQAAGWRTPRT